MRPRAMAAMDIDSARGKNHAGSPGARDARRKSPRGSVGALGRSSPDAVAKAKRAASDAPERRVLFADSALKPSGDAEGAALDDFGEDSEDEAEAIMPTQAAPPRDRGPMRHHRGRTEKKSSAASSQISKLHPKSTKYHMCRCVFCLICSHQPA